MMTIDERFVCIILRGIQTAKVMSYVFFSTSKCIKVSLSARTRPDLLSADSLTQIPYD